MSDCSNAALPQNDNQRKVVLSENTTNKYCTKVSGEKAETRTRNLRGLQGGVKRVLCLALPVLCILYILEIYRYFGFLPITEQYVGMFLSLVLSLTFLLYPASMKAPMDKVPWYDIMLSCAGFFVGIYVVIFFPRLMFIIGQLTPFRVALGGVAILLVLEAVRRVTGWPLVVVIILFMFFARFSFLLPGFLYSEGIGWQRLLWSLYMSPNNLLGICLTVAAVIVLAFVFFGRVFFAIGGGKTVIGLSLALMGRYRGGPAKGAVIASSLFGTMSGSAVANVVTTGMFTIPLMKRTGYQPSFASAVEAVASTGGQIMPPVMGVAAFLMAELLGIPYVKVAIAAIIPALLFYMAVFVQVDAEAAKNGLRGMSSSELPSIKATLREGWMLIIFPLASLVYLLFVLRFRPEVSALYSAAVVLLISLFRKETRIGPGKLLHVLEDTGSGILEIGVVCAGAGLILGVVGQTGLGFALAKSFTAVGEHNLFLLLILAAMTSAILGMGLPVIASYAILAVIAAPALTEFGLHPLAAHLFIFYFGVLSFLTPPVCMAVYAAAALGDAPFLRTALRAMGLAIVAYIIPFIFVTDPKLLLMGPILGIIKILFKCIIAVVAIGIGIEGYLFNELNWLKRISFILGSFLLFIPGWISPTLGLCGLVVVVTWEVRGRFFKTVPTGSN